MFSPDIVTSDAFLDMPTSSQLLYFHLGMCADDDGFVSSPKKVLRMIGGNPDDLSILFAKRFIIGFENGVVVIKHWKINNLVRKDWYKKTVYQEQFELLEIKENGSYTEKLEAPLTKTQRKITDSLTQVRLGKVSIGKDINILTNVDEKNSHPLSANGIKKEPSKQQQLYRRIIFHLQDALNTKITTWGTQCKAIKSMFDAGYTELQIIKTIDYMANKDEWYADKGFDLVTVAKQIPLYKAKMRKEKND